MGKAELLRDLREKTGLIELPKKQFWTAPDFPAGVAKGIVVELLGNARTEWLLQLFSMHPEHYIFWCERKVAANPTAFHQRGISLERIKFINSTKDLQQPLRLALDSQFYPFIVAPNHFDEVRIFQRLSLLAEKSKSTLFLLGDKKFSPAWPIALQLEIVASESGFKIEIQKQKHGVAE